ncbi:DivIVA domain-containing protein [Actinoallomurus rhizosphaericola]|uniref:DivIVA domain-containing protein n=1 Tax=Actinoallomurus rhizosphaericola TaxID=2952536 RepID=UPI002090F6D2|nr:DivIVA domain-containing protein [Actinoallomurus rhizosphaericola]MCO5992125.1 DivIVA domain-containing protein [Actinoallomurus rhizosphaericola]
MTSPEMHAAQRITPAELQAVNFQRAPLGRRGFDEDQVKAFLGQVEQELVRVLNEKADLENEVGRLRERLAGGGADAGTIQPEDAHIQAVRILSNAQQTADQYVADAQRYSREIAEEARRGRDEILADARSRATLVLEEAHRQASYAAEQVAPSTEPMSGDERRDLEREIAYLRTFSDVYRTHLRSYLEALLRNVEEWEKSERDSLAGTRAALPRMS